MSEKKLKKVTRVGIFFAGIISLVFGYILWTEILNIEQVFAIMFFIAGLTKIVWSFIIK